MRTTVIESLPWIEDPGYLSPWIEPSYVPGPDEGHVYFGANPSWTPHEERDRSETGEPCERCGGRGGAIEDGSDLACAACGRWGHDDALTRRMQEEADRRGSIGPVPRPEPDA